MSLSHSPRIITDGLVLCLDAGNPKSYPGSGTTWTDLSGNGNNGTLVNGVGYSDGYLSFDGSDDKVTLPSNNVNGLSSGTTDFSILTWVKYNSTTAYTAFFEKQNGAGQTVGTPRLDLGWIGTTIYLTTYNSTSGNRDPGTFTYTNDPESWYHICLVCGNNYKRGYINGEEKLTGNTFTSNLPENDQNLGIGGNIRELNGNIAQVSIYNKALTASEIQQNFNALRSRFSI